MKKIFTLLALAFCLDAGAQCTPPSAPILTAPTSVNNVSCQGSPYALTVNSGTNVAVWYSGNTWLYTGSSYTPPASLAPGTYTYSVIDSIPIVNGCINAPPSANTMTLSLVVNPTPTVTPLADITYCANSLIPAINFSGSSGATFNWTTITNPNTVNTGIAASGAGNISPFIGTNNTFVLAITTVSVTPSYGGCVGNSTSFSISINPIPLMTAIGATVCPSIAGMPNTVPSPEIVTSPASGVAYNWSVTNNINIGMAASGTGTPVAYSAPSNTTLINQIGVITYTPVLDGCFGVTTTDTVCVKPTPYMHSIANQYWCPGYMNNSGNF